MGKTADENDIEVVTADGPVQVAMDQLQHQTGTLMTKHTDLTWASASGSGGRELSSSD